jgi:hypothetical protein
LGEFAGAAGDPSVAAGKARLVNPKMELIRALEERGLRTMARRARAGEYSGLASPHATPVVKLVTDLEAAGHKDLADRARNGDFDHER